MASTAEGRRLTERHRLAQLALAARIDKQARALWPRLKVADLDRTTPAWLGANVAATRALFDESTALAAAYVSNYRSAELGSPAGPVVVPEFDTSEMRQALILAGPVRVKLLIKHGENPDTAANGAVKKFAGIARRQVLSGGRMLIDLTTRRDSRAIGWRRVTDGDPCAFCAMLASRGPSYGSQESAQRIGGTGLRFHGHCGCTAEIVYGEWQPTEAEQRYIDEYEKAAKEANEAGLPRTQDTVLHRMRSNGVFRDSPLSRNN